LAVQVFDKMVIAGDHFFHRNFLNSLMHSALTVAALNQNSTNQRSNGFLIISRNI
jgi:hypothetical protein